MNGDGKVDLVELARVLRAASKRYPHLAEHAAHLEAKNSSTPGRSTLSEAVLETHGLPGEYADLNGDGKVDLVELARVLRAASTRYPHLAEHAAHLEAKNSR
uniref:EF-hand domain-containing protein n=1 Tax=Tetradesmus obliquus TaxID=3088 RepID=A0A383VIB0_TETOB|eukprot:jgi/Sobl393_1/17618/SZX64116.1